MDTRRIKLGWNGKNRPTPKKIQKILSSLKYVLGTVSVSALATQNVYIGFWLLFAGGVIDEISKYCYEE